LKPNKTDKKQKSPRGGFFHTSGDLFISAAKRYNGRKTREDAMYKNIEKQTVLKLKDLVEYQTGQVVSKTLVQNAAVGVTLFAFDKGEEISTHTAGGDALVTVLDGIGRFTVGGDEFFLNAGESLVMPKGIPHAVFGEERFKMQLTVSF